MTKHLLNAFPPDTVQAILESASRSKQCTTWISSIPASHHLRTHEIQTQNIIIHTCRFPLHQGPLALLHVLTRSADASADTPSSPLIRSFSASPSRDLNVLTLATWSTDRPVDISNRRNMSTILDSFIDDRRPHSINGYGEESMRIGSIH